MFIFRGYETTTLSVVLFHFDFKPRLWMNVEIVVCLCKTVIDVSLRRESVLCHQVNEKDALFYDNSLWVFFTNEFFIKFVKR